MKNKYCKKIKLIDNIYEMCLKKTKGGADFCDECQNDRSG